MKSMIVSEAGIGERRGMRRVIMAESPEDAVRRAGIGRPGEVVRVFTDDPGERRTFFVVPQA